MWPGWGEDGALQAVTEFAKTIEDLAPQRTRSRTSRRELDALVAAYLEDSTRRGEPAVLVPADPELEQ